MKATKEGKRFVLATFLIAVAAVNTGNNLIYLILALMLSLSLLSLLLLKINLSGISLLVSVNPPVFAGEEATLVLRVNNGKRRVPSYSVHVTAPGAAAPVYCTLAPSGGSVQKEIRAKFERRGLYHYGEFSLMSGFPFILFTLSRSLKVSGEVLVYPALRDVEHLLTEVTGGEGGGPVNVIGRGDEISSLREFRYGDDWRKIHWKASAKASEILVKEFTEHELNKTTIVLDNLDHGSYSDETFEKAVSLAGSVARYFLDIGHLVRVVSCKKVVPYGGGDEQLYKILDILALIRKEDSWAGEMPRERDGLVISVLGHAGDGGAISAAGGDLVLYADTL